MRKSWYTLSVLFYTGRVHGYDAREHGPPTWVSKMTPVMNTRNHDP